jgi:hypothetical protein
VYHHVMNVSIDVHKASVSDEAEEEDSDRVVGIKRKSVIDTGELMEVDEGDSYRVVSAIGQERDSFAIRGSFASKGIVVGDIEIVVGIVVGQERDIEVDEGYSDRGEVGILMDEVVVNGAILMDEVVVSVDIEAMEVEGKSVGDEEEHMEVDGSVINSEVKKKKGKKGKGSVRKRMFRREN